VCDTICLVVICVRSILLLYDRDTFGVPLFDYYDHYPRPRTLWQATYLIGSAGALLQSVSLKRYQVKNVINLHNHVKQFYLVNECDLENLPPTMCAKIVKRSKFLAFAFHAAKFCYIPGIAFDVLAFYSGRYPLTI